MSRTTIHLVDYDNEVPDTAPTSPLPGFAILRGAEISRTGQLGPDVQIGGKMRQAATILSVPMALVLSLGGCEHTPTSSSFTQNEANTAMPVQFGTLTSIRAVEIRPGQTRLGTIAGAALGGVGGSQIGRSAAANVAGAIGGAVAGGAIGSALQGSGRTNGVELTVELDSGETVAVVQPGNPNDYRVGDRVRIVSQGVV